MLLLLQKITVLNVASAWHTQTVDILIENGSITAIAPNIAAPSEAAIFDGTGKYVSGGWLDLGAHTGDPGFEARDTLHSVAAAAAAGGFTAVACMPNTLPTTDTKADVSYILNKTRQSAVTFLPIGAVTQQCAGKLLTEIYDLQHAGAVGFSDGKNPIQDGGLMLRALQYVKPFGGIIFNQPHDDSLVGGRGQMHEGLQSTLLGMKGAPAIAEELMLQRDLYLADYTDSRLHTHCISTAQSVALVRAAKQRGLRVTASVAVANLALTDAALHEFEAQYKVFPHLRESADQAALCAGLLDGTIDVICSNHSPYEEDDKKLEFQYAKYGMIGLETAFAVANTFTTLSAAQLVEKLSDNPRHILGLPPIHIAVGEAANLTIFDTETTWTFAPQHIRSLSQNTPFLGSTLRGRVYGIVHNDQFVV